MSAPALTAGGRGELTRSDRRYHALTHVLGLSEPEPWLEKIIAGLGEDKIFIGGRPERPEQVHRGLLLAGNSSAMEMAGYRKSMQMAAAELVKGMAGLPVEVPDVQAELEKTQRRVGGRQRDGFAIEEMVWHLDNPSTRPEAPSSATAPPEVLGWYLGEGASDVKKRLGRVLVAVGEEVRGGGPAQGQLVGLGSRADLNGCRVEVEGPAVGKDGAPRVAVRLLVGAEAGTVIKVKPANLELDEDSVMDPSLRGGILGLDGKRLHKLCTWLLTRVNRLTFGEQFFRQWLAKCPAGSSPAVHAIEALDTSTAFGLLMRVSLYDTAGLPEKAAEELRPIKDVFSDLGDFWRDEATEDEEGPASLYLLSDRVDLLRAEFGRVDLRGPSDQRTAEAFGDCMDLLEVADGPLVGEQKQVFKEVVEHFPVVCGLGSQPHPGEDPTSTSIVHMLAAGKPADAGLLDFVLCKGGEEVLQTAVNHGATYGISPAHLAARVGNLDTLRVLLAAKPEIANAVDRNKETPLHVACRAGHEALAVVLKMRGADIMAKNYRGQLASDVAQGAAVRAMNGDVTFRRAQDQAKARRDQVFPQAARNAALQERHEAEADAFYTGLRAAAEARAAQRR